MADISTITSNGATYSIKDSATREAIKQLTNSTLVESDNPNKNFKSGLLDTFTRITKGANSSFANVTAFNNAEKYTLSIHS